MGLGTRGEANLGFDFLRGIEPVRRVAEAMGRGDDLMIDLGVRNFWEVPTAIRRARAFGKLGVYWLEEPPEHSDPGGYAALRAATGIRIAYGDREWNARGVERIVDAGRVDMIRLDTGRVEG